MSSENHEALLTEYEICDEKAGRLDSLIWQTASVIFPITLAGFTYFGLLPTHTPENVPIVLIVGIGSITLLMTWYLLSRAWYSYQSLAFYRMREIENELGLWHYRYSGFVRKSNDEQETMLGKVTDEDKNRLQKMKSQVDSFTRVGLHITTQAITAIFILGWLILIIREFVLAF
jgi:hypothetical protein